MGKILLVEMGRSFANYFCGARVFLNKIMHVSGVSRSRETEESEAEVVFIWHHNCNRKILGVCCCFWATLHFVSPWADWVRSACEPLFWLSHSDERMAEWRNCASPSTAPHPTSPLGGLAQIHQGVPGLGSKTCKAAGIADIFSLPASGLPEEAAQLLLPLDLPALSSCVHTSAPAKPQNLI